MHEQLPSGASGLNFHTSVHLHTFIVYKTRECSGDAAYVRRLAWALITEPATNIKKSSSGSYQWACMLSLVDKASGLELRIWEWTMFLDMLVGGQNVLFGQ